MSACRICGRALTGDEISLHRRMVNRGDTTYMCLSCMAAHYGCTTGLLEEKIRHFREIGCLLFSPVKKD